MNINRAMRQFAIRARLVTPIWRQMSLYSYCGKDDEIAWWTSTFNTMVENALGLDWRMLRGL